MLIFKKKLYNKINKCQFFFFKNVFNRLTYIKIIHKIKIKDKK